MAVGFNVIICASIAVIVSFYPVFPILVVFMLVMGALGGSLVGLFGPLVVDAIGREHSGLGVGIGVSLFGVATTISPPLIGLYFFKQHLSVNRCLSEYSIRNGDVCTSVKLAAYSHSAADSPKRLKSKFTPSLTTHVTETNLFPRFRPS